MNFEKYPVERVFNWSPKSYTGETPTYNFKDQTESKSAKKLPYLIELARIEDEKRENTFIACSGMLMFDDYDPAHNITKLSLAEIVKKRSQEKLMSEEEAASAQEAEKPNEAEMKPSDEPNAKERATEPKKAEKATKAKETAKTKKNDVNTLLSDNLEL